MASVPAPRSTQLTPACGARRDPEEASVQVELLPRPQVSLRPGEGWWQLQGVGEVKQGGEDVGIGWNQYDTEEYGRSWDRSDVATF